MLDGWHAIKKLLIDQVGVTPQLQNVALNQGHPNKRGSHTMKYKRCTTGCCGDQMHKHGAHAMHAACLTAHAYKLRPFNAVKPPIMDPLRQGHNIIDLSKKDTFQGPK